jgi:D-alanine-D-alanine ligase
MSKIRVAVLRGGPSEEYDVSLVTGAGMLAALDRNRYDPLDVVVTKRGEWLLAGRMREPHEVLSLIDIALLAFHGAYGEDGQVQRLLERHGVAYSGSGPLASAIALNKPLTKETLKKHDIRMARHMVIGRDVKDNIPGAVAAIMALFGPRYIVKPLASGSSVGTAFAESPLALERVLATALSVYDQVLVEEYIEGREATCGVVEGFRDHAVYVLPPIEIARSTPVWGYTEKYDGSVEEICPGRFSREEKDEIEHLARFAHETLGLAHYSRSDFIVADDGIYFLEVNTLPGLTPTSLFPKALEAVGCSYASFIDHLLHLAHNRRQRI